MSCHYNPLIEAPHVPPKTTAPRWRDFLDHHHTLNRQANKLGRRSDDNREQHQRFEQVEAVEQPGQTEQPAFHQRSPWQQSTQQLTASSRWRSQPRQQTTQQLNMQTIAGSVEQQQGNWVALKKAQQLAGQGAHGHQIMQPQPLLNLQRNPSVQQQASHRATSAAQADHTAAQQASRPSQPQELTNAWYMDEEDVQLLSDDDWLEPIEQQHKQPHVLCEAVDRPQPSMQSQQVQTFSRSLAGTTCEVQPVNPSINSQHLEGPHAGATHTSATAQLVFANPQHCMHPWTNQAHYSLQDMAATASSSCMNASRLNMAGHQPLHSNKLQHQQNIFVSLGPGQQQQQSNWIHCKQQQQGQQTAYSAQAASASRWSAGTAAILQPLRQPKQQRSRADTTPATSHNPTSHAASAATKSGSKKANRDSSSGSGQSGTSQGTTQTGSQSQPSEAGREEGVQEKQDKMHQETIFSVLMRSQRKQQSEQQQWQRQKAQNKLSAVGSKRPGSTAEAAQQASIQNVAPKVPDATVAEKDDIGRSAKKARKSAQTAGAPLQPAAVEALDMWVLGNNQAMQNNIFSSTANNRKGAADSSSSANLLSSAFCVIDLGGQGAEQQLREELAAAEGVVLGLLMSQTAGSALQYFTSLQELTKEQQQLLRKHARASRKANMAANDTAAEAAGSDGLGVSRTVGIAIMPVTVTGIAAQHEAAASSNIGMMFKMYYLHLAGDKDAVPQNQHLPATVLQLLSELMSDFRRPCVCSNAKAVLCSLLLLGLQLPPAGRASVVDPEVLAWLLNPQLVQDSKSAACYTLQQALSRHHVQQAASLTDKGQTAGPLHRLYQQLHQSLHLADELLNSLKTCVAGDAIKLEMQMCAVLAKMELAGVGVQPQYLLEHKSTLLQHIHVINSQATLIAGRPFNLSSSSQLATVLYEDLRLPAPTAGGGRGSAKTHLPTDEQTLKQLAALHPLPGLVLEHRCIQNVLSKWIDSDWMQEATQQSVAAGGLAVVDVHCSWNQVATATGRLSSSNPNLQAVTKYTISAATQQQQPQNPLTTSSAAPSPISINIRDAFVARSGTILLSADYSQIELRLLAHFSEDRLLRQLLHQSGSQGDVFKLIAAAWMKPGDTAGDIDAATRERAKRVVYGIIYGLSAYGLSQQLADQGVTVDEAKRLIDSFLSRFQGVRQFMATSLQRAQVEGSVKTLMQRVRPITGLTASNYKDRSAMERRVVNSIIQGSAADLIKLVMRDWDDWAATADAGAKTIDQQPQTAAQQLNTATMVQAAAEAAPSTTAGDELKAQRVGARLIAQIHDELLFEVDAVGTVIQPDGSVLPGPHLQQTAKVVENIMGLQKLQLSVPLKVNLSFGPRWGSLQKL